MTSNDLNEILFVKLQKWKAKTKKLFKRSENESNTHQLPPPTRKAPPVSQTMTGRGSRFESGNCWFSYFWSQLWDLSLEKEAHGSPSITGTWTARYRQSSSPLPTLGWKKIIEEKSWQRALRALHEDYHQSWQNFKIAPIYLPTLRNTNLIVQSCDAITFSIKGHRPILIIIKSFSEPQYAKSKKNSH